MIHGNPMRLIGRFLAGGAVMPSDAGRALGAIAKQNAAARRADTFARLKECVATNNIAPMEWK